MTKTITDIELLKKLQPILEDVETEYWLAKDTIWNYNVTKIYNTQKWLAYPKIWFKTLTLQEAIDILPRDVWNWELVFTKNSCRYQDILLDWNQWLLMFNWETLLQAISKMLTYLIDNNLLIK